MQLNEQTVLALLFSFVASATPSTREETKQNQPRTEERDAPAVSKPTAVRDAIPSTQERKAANESACQKRGGQYRRLGDAGFYFCVESTKDAGKICTDGSECEGGSCIAFEEPKSWIDSVYIFNWNWEDVKYALGWRLHGRCIEHNNGLGSCLDLVEKGKRGGDLCGD